MEVRSVLIDDVMKAKSGDQEAFTRLFQIINTRLNVLASKALQNNIDLEDVIQETRMVAWEKIHQLKDPTKFEGWCIRILENKCKEMKRKRRREVLVPLEELESIFHAASPYFTEEMMDLKSCLERLNEPYRTTLKLHYFHHLSIKEMASLLSIPEGTVKSRIYYAKKKILSVNPLL